LLRVMRQTALSQVRKQRRRLQKQVIPCQNLNFNHEKFWMDIVREGGKKIPIAIVIPLQFAVKFLPMITEASVQLRNQLESRGQVALINCLQILGLSFILALLATPCLAQEQADGGSSVQSGGWSIDRWFIFTSVYTKHFDPDPDHVNNQKLLGIEGTVTKNHTRTKSHSMAWGWRPPSCPRWVSGINFLSRKSAWPVLRQSM